MDRSGERLARGVSLAKQDMKRLNRRSSPVPSAGMPSAVPWPPLVTSVLDELCATSAILLDFLL